ncbi:MAG TPA: hypothetical protein VG167_18775 [Verrucomicrobiae bacterium]|nr:hypothetical protein [Verrucomicrobiae bacterium]
MKPKQTLAEPAAIAGREARLYTPAPDLAAEVRELRARAEALERKLDEFRSGYKFNGDDSTFLIWTLGFVAGANLERGGDQGERIYARCRDIWMKTFPATGGAGINPS